jgi:hydrogenase nickel incorporation protein HypB
MCTSCGCDAHEDGHGHDRQERSPARARKVEIDVLEKSRRFAADNRAWLRRHGVFMLNLMSAPGAGKTTLLERTARELGADVPLHVIEGDQATAIDADRVRAAGARAHQVNTGTGCHLDPHMVRHGLERLRPPRGACVVVENVGNLVCPALFDLGEEDRVVLLSTPEGDDKPLKYPHMFLGATLVLLTKIDLLPYVPFDVARFSAAVQRLNGRAAIVAVSAQTGEGMNDFYRFIRERSISPRREQGALA